MTVSGMRRPQTVRTYPPHRPRDDAPVVIDAAACRETLKRRHLTPAERLLLMVAVEHGDGIITFGELKRRVMARG